MEIEEKGFWASLFDFSFKSFALPKLVSILYIIAIVVIVLFILFYVVVAFINDILTGIVVLVVGAPVSFFLSVFCTRLWLETIMIIYRIKEDLMEIKKGKEKAEGQTEEEEI